MIKNPIKIVSKRIFLHSNLETIANKMSRIIIPTTNKKVGEINDKVDPVDRWKEGPELGMNTSFLI